MIQFQSTHPRGVRQSCKAVSGVPIRFQSTHPRGVRHLMSKGLGKSFVISIHAPTWGATLSVLVLLSYTVFQSTHPRGVRHKLLSKLIDKWNFNPRTHVGCDDWIKRFRTRLSHFNPRTHVGCDYDDWYRDSRIQFQSTHPRGVRRKFGKV